MHECEIDSYIPGPACCTYVLVLFARLTGQALIICKL